MSPRQLRLGRAGGFSRAAGTALAGAATKAATLARGPKDFRTLNPADPSPAILPPLKNWSKAFP